MAEANNQTTETEVKSTATEETPTSPANVAPVTRMTVDDRPKKQEDTKETERRCKSALVRSGRDKSVYGQLSQQDREELASLDRAYPEGAMFLKAADRAFKAMRDRKAKATT